MYYIVKEGDVYKRQDHVCVVVCIDSCGAVSYTHLMKKLIKSEEGISEEKKKNIQVKHKKGDNMNYNEQKYANKRIKMCIRDRNLGSK